jgi:hypothetical protein
VVKRLYFEKPLMLSISAKFNFATLFLVLVMSALAKGSFVFCAVGGAFLAKNKCAFRALAFF